jgi:transposase
VLLQASPEEVGYGRFIRHGLASYMNPLMLSHHLTGWTPILFRWDSTMIRIHLPPAEVERLEACFRSTDDRKLRDRLQIVLMAYRGRAHQDIAADLGVDRKTVTRWLNAFCAGGRAALQPKKAPGKPCRIPASLADELRCWVIDGPAKQGLDRANWTHEELADHLRKSKGIATSRSAVQRFCAKIGIRLYRPTYRYLRGDPQQQAQAREDLADLGKGRRPVNSSS